MRLVIAIFLLSIASLVMAQSVPPKPKADQQSQTEQRGTESAPLFVKVPGPTTEAERQQERYEKVEKPRNERLMLWATGILALFTAGLFFATYSIEGVQESHREAIARLRRNSSRRHSPRFNSKDTNLELWENSSLSILDTSRNV